MQKRRLFLRGGKLLSRLFIILLWINFKTVQVQALYFARANEEVILPVGCAGAQPLLFQGYVITSANELADSGVYFRLEDSPARGLAELSAPSLPPNASVYASNSEQVDIRAPPDGNKQAFQLFAKPQFKNNSKQTLNVVVCAKNQDRSPHHAPCQNIKIKVVAPLKYCAEAPTAACSGPPSALHYTVYENNQPQTLARLVHHNCRPSACNQLLPTNVTLRLNSSQKEQMLVLSEENTLELAESLNREETKNISFVLRCESPGKDGRPLVKEKQGRVTVKDENEHGPIVINEPSIITFALDEGVDKLLESVIAVKDYDSEPSDYAVELLDDVKGFFNVTYAIEPVPKSEHNPHELCFIRAILSKNREVEFEGNSYTFRIRFEDVNLANPDVSREATVVIVIQKHASKAGDPSLLDNIVGQELAAEVLPAAANHSRVPVPHMLSEEVRMRSGVRFFLEQGPGPGLPFDVTPFHGLLYVNDTRALRRLNASNYFRFRMSWRVRGEGEAGLGEGAQGALGEAGTHPRLGFVWINVNIPAGDVTTPSFEGNCGREKMCSVYGQREECARGCGPGSTAGFCHWRGQAEGGPSEEQDRPATPAPAPYATCSPDVATCPDNKCDELESLFRHLCPQDCVLSKNVYGETVNATHTQLNGIPSASTGVCTCSYTAQCACAYFSAAESQPNGSSSSEATPVVGEAQQPRAQSEDLSCGWGCILSIFSVAFVATVVVSLLAYCCVRRRRTKLSRGHKFPGSLASLPAIPSDYVDDRSSSVVSQNLLVNNDLLGLTSKLCAIDGKWEFPRSKLILEQTLGEGEFGRVVKAKALNINAASPGYTTVAVKMLKMNGSSSEQDLFSEFNLLKEVCHPNVIRLLGICIDKEGPLCIIVEYAEFGALRTFLRKSRRLEFKSCTSDDSGVDSMANGVQSEPQNWSDYQVNSRDLLSFAWQISKGMEYLSVVKLVHRDLAARNILVAANKVVKISDFGMTRDVYEGDTYFKKSMGRVPVKWLAIESLLDHIYTTKSDVWSFGIVLWEIVTLGAAPYPGVAPERLYHLLKSGYRMEKPDNCSDELYDIMRRCWKELANERPAFAELTKIFDQMLQANVEYLDLGVNIVHNLTYFEDIPLQTETIDEEGDDSEMGYGSWNALPNDDDDQYLTSNPPHAQPLTSGSEKEEISLLQKPLILPKVVRGGKIEEHAV